MKPMHGSSRTVPVGTMRQYEPEVGTGTLTLLLAEDDQISREMLLVRIEGLFRHVYAAADGDEAFQLYCEHKPDIVLTDQTMPGLSGLDLMRKIRATGAKPPVVLMTSSIDNETLLDALNIGVERFIPKPFNFHQIVQTLNKIAREIVNERLLEEHRRQEVELLRYRDSYNSMQQESARRKERHVVRHDLRNRALEGAGGVRWAINVAYSPHDIMCGDGYSVRNLFDGRQLFFVVDAMGSGMSASLTAMLATSFFNYQVEHLHLWGMFTLRIFLRRFKEYLSSMLLEEEALSCGFFLVDLAKEEMKAALFGMPPLILRNLDGSVSKVIGENPPLGIYPCETVISSIPLADVADLLVMTDGVSDADLLGGGAYREVLESDFRAAPTLAALQRRFNEKTDNDSSDDMTILHLRRLDFGNCWCWKSGLDSSLPSVGSAVEECLAALGREVGLSEGERAAVKETLAEALDNAAAYGGLKEQEALGNAPPSPDAAITLSATLWCGAGTPLLLLEIGDDGPGLPDAAVNSITVDADSPEHGLQKISRLNDSLFVGGPGGRLIILKTLEGGN